MNYEEFLKLLPYLVTFASLIVSAILGIANYQISRKTASLEKERLAHDKAIVYWDKKGHRLRGCVGSSYYGIRRLLILASHSR